MNNTRNKILKLFHAPLDYKTIFTYSATMSINIILNGIDIEDSMNVYISHFEHNAVIRTLEHIKQYKKINIVKINTNIDNLLYNIYNMQEQFEETPPDIIVLNHASNVFGNIAPAYHIFKLAKEYGATTILDCSQTAGLIDLNLKDVKSDFTIFAGHKTLYAPFGIAGFVMKNGTKIDPLIYGGTGFNSADVKMPLTYPARLEAGSMDIYAVAGLSASLDWIKEVSIKNLRNKEEELYNFTIDKLSGCNNVKIYSTNDEHIGIISFLVKGYSAEEVSAILSNNDIAVRSGLHCAPDAHKFMGTFPNGTVRLGFSYFNNQEDIQTLVDIVKML